MKKKKNGISRRSFLKTASAMGVSAASTTLFQEANAAPLRIPGGEYGREKKVPVLCQMCAQHRAYGPGLYDQRCDLWWSGR